MSTHTPVRPPKPYAGFPLFAHAKGYWAKKIGGRQITFGPWKNPDPGGAAWKAALGRYHRRCEAVARGVALDRLGVVTVGQVVTAYLEAQGKREAAGKITAGHMADCVRICRHFRDAVGEELPVAELEGRPELIVAWRDAIDGRAGWHHFNLTMSIVSTMFRWAEQPVGGVLDKPFRLRSLFRKRSAADLRKQKRLNRERVGRNLWTPDQVRAFLAYADEPLRTFILLGYFCAFGNSDCARLTASAVNLSPPASLSLPPGWATIDYTRPKTGIERAAVIPPVVAQALAAAIGVARENG